MVGRAEKMDKMLLEEKLRLYIPNNKWIRRMLTDMKMHQYDQGFVSEKDIKWAYGDPDRKKELVEKWRKKHHQAAVYLDKRINMIRDVNPGFREKTESEEYLLDVQYCYCAYGFLPFEYLNYELFSKTEEEYREYISEKEKNDIHYRLNDLKAMAYFNDKALTYKMFGELYHRDCMVIEKKKDWEQFQAFTGKHPVFFRKQVYGFGGHTVTKADLKSCPEKAFEMFESMIREGKYIIEEPIRQSKAVSVFNDSSVNTVRHTMILTKHGPKAASTFFRTGKAGAVVDNAGSGGVFAGVDAETGILNTSGVDEYGMRYEKHPDSGIVYKGYRLPDWDQLIRICTEASVKAGEMGCRNVGWDLAHTEEYGWIMVEGNAGGQLVEQNASQKGLRARIEPLLADV